MIVFKPSRAFALSHPAHLVAFGFGAGLSPWAPGTIDTLVAWPVGWLLAEAYPPNLPAAKAHKRLDQARFVWPRIEDGVMRLSPGQLGALFEGLDWKRVHSRRVPRPQVAR